MKLGDELSATDINQKFLIGEIDENYIFELVYIRK